MRKVVNEYLVTGKVEYHRTDDSLIPSIADVSIRVDASSEAEALLIALDEIRGGEAVNFDECALWLPLSAKAEYIQSCAQRDLNISSYWYRRPSEQDTMRSVVKGK